MKEHPILFSTEMVRAILDNRKSQTRRVVIPQPIGESWDERKRIKCESYAPTKIDKRTGEEYPGEDVFGFADEDEGWVCPYGQVGDRLWVRETFLDGNDYPCSDYHEGGDRYSYKADCPAEQWSGYMWKPSIFMQRKASRITLEITNIRVERVQEISNDDCEREGLWHSGGEEYRHEICVWRDSAEALKGVRRRYFKNLWDSINAKREYCSWDDNPFVWVIEFRRISP